jgi:tetratricopeptide (TPR) repeat protein
MKRFLFVAFVLLLGSQAAFARGSMVPPEPAYRQSAEYAHEEPVYVEFLPYMVLAAAADSDADISTHIRNNQYFLESVRLTELASELYAEGDYDASYDFSEEAIRYANLSDEYISLQLKIRECDDAIAAARRSLDLAVSMNAAAKYPSEYGRAQASFNAARDFRAAERWDDAIAAANLAHAVLAVVTGETVPAQGGLPAQYMVRAWSLTRDCLWNIAGRSYVYNDPWQWKTLFEANKARMPDPNNPDLIQQGMILNIPSIGGEERQGIWDAAATYPVFSR